MLHDLKNKLKEKDSQIAQLKDNRRQHPVVSSQDEEFPQADAEVDDSGNSEEELDRVESENRRNKLWSKIIEDSKVKRGNKSNVKSSSKSKSKNFRPPC